ncbi:MAG: SBBP repeat-containing protein [Bacteroidia bacterium]
MPQAQPFAGTYIGTSQYDQSYFIEVDTSNNVYVTGQTMGIIRWLETSTATRAPGSLLPNSTIT